MTTFKVYYNIRKKRQRHVSECFLLPLKLQAGASLPDAHQGSSIPLENKVSEEETQPDQTLQSVAKLGK